MTITYEDLPQAIQALKKCAKEHEKEYISFGAVRTSDLCEDVACFLQTLYMKKGATHEL